MEAHTRSLNCLAGAHHGGPLANTGRMRLPLGRQDGAAGPTRGCGKYTSQPHGALTRFCSCKRAMLMWVSVGSASLRSAALPGGGERK